MQETFHLSHPQCLCVANSPRWVSPVSLAPREFPVHPRSGAIGSGSTSEKAKPPGQRTVDVVERLWWFTVSCGSITVREDSQGALENHDGPQSWCWAQQEVHRGADTLQRVGSRTACVAGMPCPGRAAARPVLGHQQEKLLACCSRGGKCLQHRAPTLE